MRKIRLENKKVLVTGCAGFIGSNLVLRLLDEMKGGLIVGIDNLNDYYNPDLKRYRLGLVAEKCAHRGINTPPIP